MYRFVDPSEVRRIFSYDAETGRLVRKIGGRGGAKVGDLAGSTDHRGYRRTWFKGRNELTHRMVWAWHYDESPTFNVTHINGDNSDDRIENLARASELTKARRVVVSQSELRRLFGYDPGTGQFVRLVTTSHNAKAGQVAGNLRPDGYIGINVGGRIHLAHRLAWLYMYGDWPQGEVDHINRNRSDNRIENLRDAPRSLNITNTAGRGVDGLKGVSRIGERFFSRIRLADGTTKHLGTYDSPSEAHREYVKAHIERYGENSEFYRRE